MAAVIVSRIDATRRLLTALSTRTFDNGDEFKTVSKKQRCALEALMQATTINASEAASIAEALAAVPFTGTDATALMNLVSDALSAMPVALGSNHCTSLPGDATHPAVPSRLLGLAEHPRADVCKDNGSGSVDRAGLPWSDGCSREHADKALP